MIRIEEQTLYEAFLVLLWARMNGVNVDKDSVSGIVKNTVERWSRGHSTGNITQDAALDLCNSVNIKEMFGNDSMVDLIEKLGMTIHGSFLKDNNHDGDLIDTVVNALKRSRGINILSGKSLEKLRKAILIPDELMGLKERLRKGELSCGECGVSLIQGEMLSIVSDGEGSNVVICMACGTPRFTQCAGTGSAEKCEEKIPIPGVIVEEIRGLSYQKCKKCHPDKEVVDAVASSEIDALNQVLREMEPELETDYVDQDEDEDDDDPRDDDEDAVRFTVAPTPAQPAFNRQPIYSSDWIARDVISPTSAPTRTVLTTGSTSGNAMPQNQLINGSVWYTSTPVAPSAVGERLRGADIRRQTGPGIIIEDIGAPNEPR